MADGIRLTDADLERLGPAARQQVRAATGTQDTATEKGAGAPARERARPRARARTRVRVPAPVRKPVRTTAAMFGRFLVAGIGLVIAYWALNNAAAIEVILRAPTTALRWLADPTRSIPYAAPGG